MTACNVLLFFTHLRLTDKCSLQMGLSNKTLVGFRKELLQKRDLLIEDLRANTLNWIQNAEHYTDSIDVASAETERDFSLRLKDRDRETLRQIDRAIEKMNSGKFGSCDRCHTEIGESRLRAFLFASLCVDCKSEIESRRHRYLPTSRAMI